MDDLVDVNDDGSVDDSSSDEEQDGDVVGALLTAAKSFGPEERKSAAFGALCDRVAECTAQRLAGTREYIDLTTHVRLSGAVDMMPEVWDAIDTQLPLDLRQHAFLTVLRRGQAGEVDFILRAPCINIEQKGQGESRIRPDHPLVTENHDAGIWDQIRSVVTRQLSQGRDEIVAKAKILVAVCGRGWLPREMGKML
jgi:hypothetical protein